MATKQLSLNIDSRLADRLTKLKLKTHVSKKALVEQGIRLLLEKYEQLGNYYDSGTVNEDFIRLAESQMTEYKATMKKLAE